MASELAQIVECSNKNEPCVFGNVEFELFHQKPTFYNGFRGNRLRQHVRNDHGIIPCFHTNPDFDMSVADRTQLFQKTNFAVFLYKQFIAL